MRFALAALVLLAGCQSVPDGENLVCTLPMPTVLATPMSPPITPARFRFEISREMR